MKGLRKPVCVAAESHIAAPHSMNVSLPHAHTGETTQTSQD